MPNLKDILTKDNIVRLINGLKEDFSSSSNIKNGTDTCRDTKSTSPTGNQTAIIAIKIIDNDSSDQFLSADGEQYVNLTKDKAWIDNKTIFQKERCSNKVHLKVQFNKPGVHSFTVTRKKGSGNSQYTASEISRNTNFDVSEITKKYTTDSNGTKIINDDLTKLTPAGLDKFWFEAKDDNNKKASSVQLETKRIIHLVEVKMKGLKSSSDNLAVVKSEYATHGITLNTLNSVKIERMYNISPTDYSVFKKNVQTAYTTSEGPSKAPYAIAVAYTDHLAVKSENQKFYRSISINLKRTPIKIPIFIKGKSKFLWKNIVPGEDWFVSAIFMKKGGIVGKDEIIIPREKCRAIFEKDDYPERCRTVEIDVKGLPLKKGEIMLEVNVVDWMAGGLSFTGKNLVCVCTRAWWKENPTHKINAVIIHELGHQIGMAPNGTGPDKTTTHYIDKGHKGNHCHHGLPVQPSYSEASGATCVMFGATTSNTHMFCSNCSPAIKKVDLSNGWKDL